MFTDRYPGRPKILFVGNPGSSHVQGWIDLINSAELNIRLFSCTDGYPAPEWHVPTYLIDKYPPSGLDPVWRESWWPAPEDWDDFYANSEKTPKILKLLDKLFFRLSKTYPLFSDLQKALPILRPSKSNTLSPEEWLAVVIKSWRPDIVHTIGLDEGTDYYFRVCNQYGISEHGKWIIKIFGGSDVAFKIFDKESLQSVSHIFSLATHVLFDNKYYPEVLIKKKALKPEKICPLTPVPGSGGVNVDEMHRKWSCPTSYRRVIVWPKSYETIWSKAVPVLFALRSVWNRIQPCEVYMLAVNPEMKQWFSTLPDDMRTRIQVFSGVPRKTVLEIMLKSRVVLAPSLIDGVPNVLYEAMACGALPIVSPIPTIKDVVTEKNVIFAENLNQADIEQALLKAMTDDAFVDECTARNIELVKELADVKKIQPKLIQYYKSLMNFEA